VSALAIFDGLVKRFGDITAVDGLSFQVPADSVVGLLGPNGAGKTTAIRVLLGLASPTAGDTALLGAHPGSEAFPAAIRATGSLIEGPALYRRATGRQNLAIEAAALGVEVSRAEMESLLSLVGLADRADSKAGEYSLGMKQRLGLAVALIGRPRLVVLDEPTNGMDPAGIVEIRKLIKRLPEFGTTVLVSSHLLAEVQLMCDRAAIINRGRLVAEGSISELLTQGGGANGFVVQVAPELGERAHHLLHHAGIAVGSATGGRLTVSGPVADGAQISRPLAEGGVHVSELRRLETSLEDVFLSLTEAADGG
jgi:ABC-type multidrug transport system ATPase subunit